MISVQLGDVSSRLLAIGPSVVQESVPFCIDPMCSPFGGKVAQNVTIMSPHGRLTERLSAKLRPCLRLVSLKSRPLNFSTSHSSDLQTLEA